MNPSPPRRVDRRFAVQAAGVWALAAGAARTDAADRLTGGASGRAALRVLSAEVGFRRERLATPLKLSSGTIAEITAATAVVEVETERGRLRTQGRGAIYLSDLWAWPAPELTHASRDAVLRTVCEQLARRLPDLTAEEPLHPTELGLRLHHQACTALEVEHDPPALALGMCASPFDAALHDAAGLALETPAFDLYDDDPCLPSADAWFPGTTAASAIRRVLTPPRAELPAWLVLSPSTDFQPQLQAAWERGGYRHFKLKLGGSAADDAEGTVQCFRAMQRLGIDPIVLSVDSNEANPDAQSVLNYLDALEAADPKAYQALLYLEQPTSRDLRTHAFDWREVAARKPVLVDEGLTSLETLPLAREQGWSGVALKTCKGHSMLLASAAWAHHNGMVMSLQDLTNPGIALIHAALVGARLPTLNGAELNSPQFTPGANREFVPRLSPLFEPRRGVHRLPSTLPPGLGSCL